MFERAPVSRGGSLKLPPSVASELAAQAELGDAHQARESAEYAEKVFKSYQDTYRSVSLWQRFDRVRNLINLGDLQRRAAPGEMVSCSHAVFQISSRRTTSETDRSTDIGLYC